MKERKKERKESQRYHTVGGRGEDSFSLPLFNETFSRSITRWISSSFDSEESFSRRTFIARIASVFAREEGKGGEWSKRERTVVVNERGREEEFSAFLSVLFLVLTPLRSLSIDWEGKNEVVPVTEDYEWRWNEENRNQISFFFHPFLRIPPCTFKTDQTHPYLFIDDPLTAPEASQTSPNRISHRPSSLATFGKERWRRRRNGFFPYSKDTPLLLLSPSLVLSVHLSAFLPTMYSLLSYISPLIHLLRE